MTLLLESASNILTWFLSDEGILNLETTEVGGADQREVGYHIREARRHVFNALEILKKN